MSYTPTTWATGDTITATKLNKIENGIASAGGYDLVIVADTTNGHQFGYLTTSDITVVEGNILDVEEKIDDGEPINAILVIKDSWSFKPSTANTPYMGFYLPLTKWEAPYCAMTFASVIGGSINTINYYVMLGYDYETGDITSIVAQGSRTLAGA